MWTGGVDLAAEAKGTALAVIEWCDDLALLRELHVGVADDRIVDVIPRLDKLGIDCAFGWPDNFVQFVAAHSALELFPSDVDGGMEWRRTLAYRETDREVRRLTGRWPLSVSTDRLGLTAMRCAGLLARIQASGIPVDRAGGGIVVEVYPGASLRQWKLPTAGYRTDPEARGTLLQALRDAAPWFRVSDHHAALMRKSADAFDAVIAAFSARSAATGWYNAPAADDERARREGWIALPSGVLADLGSTP